MRSRRTRKEYKILKFVLQPLVENCNSSWYSWVCERWNYYVRLREEDGFYVWQVEDNGVGMSERTWSGFKGRKRGEKENLLDLWVRFAGFLLLRGRYAYKITSRIHQGTRDMDLYSCGESSKMRVGDYMLKTYDCRR